VLAVSLAAVGLYSLVAFSVAERRKEFGIRMALGARVRQILDHVLRQGAVLGALGIPVGLLGAFGLSQLFSHKLFGVTPLEPYVYLLATSLLFLVAIVASVVPALAAARVDPMIALRSE
jgi:ABC-type antimicrobial peptide transport system permease subunit